MNRLLYDTLRQGAFAMHASGARPAWLFESDGSRLIFANAAGAAALGFATCRDAAGAAVAGELSAQLSRSAVTMRVDSPPRLQRLRGLGSAFGQPLTCACTRVKFGSGTAMLVAATEPVGPPLSLAERARYLIEGHGAVAAFGADGRLLHATAEAAPHTGGSPSLADLADGIETLRIGAGADAMVLAFFPAHSRPITSGPDVAATKPVFLDLSRIAEAITAMTKVPPQQNGPDTKSGVAARDADANGSSEGPERRSSLRFFWETDAQNRFTINSDIFIALAGPRTANLLGRFWGEISAKLALDPEGLVAHALVSRDTWSGIEVNWPTSGGDVVRVTLSGIPTFDRDRTFRGYRGLGVWHGEAPDNVKAMEPVEPEPLPPAEPILSAARAPDRPAATLQEAPAKTPPQAPSQMQDEARSHTADQAPPQSENVVPFRTAGSDLKAAGLNPAERNAFRDLGSRLSARLKGADELARGLMEKTDPHEDPPYVPPVPVAAPLAQAHRQAEASPDLPPEDDGELSAQRPVLEKIPLGILIYHGSNFIYANPAFLRFAGHDSLPAFVEAGGLDSMFVEFESVADAEGGQRLRISAGDGPAMQGQLVTASIDGEKATVLMLQPATTAPAQQPAEGASRAAELAALLDIAFDGVVTIDRSGTIVSAGANAEKLFGYDSGALIGRLFGDLFAPESERVAKARLDRLCRGQAPADGDGREIIGRRRQGGLISLQLTLGRTGEAAARFHALFRDITRWKEAEKEMTAARQQAEKASAAKSEFLAKISHEMRTPLNAIIGFSEVMMEERFGAVGNERYRDYLKDIHTSGAHLVSLLNDLLDLSKIEAGKMELSFERVELNEIIQQSVAIMQAQANRARVIMRTALSMNVSPIVADARSLRQIVLNLLSNSIKFTGAGGQVIVSTAANDRGDVMLRVRDTGVGMSEKDIETALQPFRQLTTSPRTDANGTGLGLPLTKALVEANRARFSIKSAVNAGTLVEIVFPAGVAGSTFA